MHSFGWIDREDPAFWDQLLWNEPWWSVTGGRLPDDVLVLVRLGTSDDGRVAVTGLIVGASVEPPRGHGMALHGESRLEVSGELLRKISVRDIVDDFETYRATPGYVARGAFEAAGRSAAKARIPPTRRRPGPKGHPAEHYENVASAWRAAQQRSPHRPMTAFLEANPELHVSEPQVYRWLAECRRRGLLPARTRATSGGRAKAADTASEQETR
jgi:hypothetical protein